MSRALALPPLAFAACLRLPTGLHTPGESASAARLEALAAPPAAFDNAVAKLDGRDLVMTFRGERGSVEVAPERLGWPQDLRGYARVVARVENGATPATILVSLAAARGRLVAGRDLGARGTALLTIDLDDLPLAATAEAPYGIEAVRIECAAVGGEPTIKLRVLALERRTSANKPRVDTFGQRAGVQWQGKVQRSEDLEAAARDEMLALARLKPPPNLNSYGGWTKGPSWQESGFFSIEADGDGRAWFADPLGNAFWSFGVTGVRTRADATPVRGREGVFEHLPDPGSSDGRQVYLPTAAGPGLAFYRWNVVRKWGSFEVWRERTLDRLTHWGFNTIGAETVDPDVLLQRRLPHVRTLSTRGAAGVAHTPGGFPDVFDDRWAAHLSSAFASEAARGADNPWLLGTLVDDGLPWDLMDLHEAPVGSPLRERQDSLRRETQREDREAFETIYAQTYFETVARALREHDPDHLYLAGRLRAGALARQGVLRAAGKHAAVVMVTVERDAPDPRALESAHAAAGKPLIVVVTIPALLSDRQIAHPKTGPSPAVTAAARRTLLARTADALAALPFVVGVHWSQYVDQPITGRSPDGDNRLIGLVDVTDRPHDELVSALREAAERVHDVHAGKARARGREAR